MTITEQQLDAVLPRTPAGLALASLDPTDDDDRHQIIADLLDLYRRAEAQSAPTHQTTPRDAAHVHWGVSEATVGWPPPKPTLTPYRTYAGVPLPIDPRLDPRLDALLDEEERIARERNAR